MANLVRMVPQYYGAATINTTDYGVSIYTAYSSTPWVPVRYSNCQRKSHVDPKFVEQIARIPIPANAVAPTGSDGSMVIWHPSSRTVWELWRARKDEQGWSACWGGRLTDVGNMNGHYRELGNASRAVTGSSPVGGAFSPGQRLAARPPS